MKQVIQHLLFPDDESLMSCRKLFYRGDRGILTKLGEGGRLCVGKFQYVEFNTYLNGFSYAKWKKYTPMESLTLQLTISGSFRLAIVGYSLENEVPVRNVFRTEEYHHPEARTISLTFPDNKETTVGFEISALTEVELYGGCYEAEFPEEGRRDIELALSTTTFKKEDYIRRNTRRMVTGLFEKYPEISEHICMHIVDNGRTLVPEDVPEDRRFIVHKNPNAGGAGGFARGMIECLHQDPKPTNVILMDDDILILPESIYRTFLLLRWLKPEYREHFISGAMLILEDKSRQHEDVGCILPDGGYSQLKPQWNHDFLYDNLKNEYDYQAPNCYQAWWYCCIPMTVIEKNGLPMPIFIRGDDSEYGLRCKAKIITMNGICLWHMGFYGKYSGSQNIYQEYRNLLVNQATTGVLPEIDLMPRFKKTFRANILKHDYNSCELALRALEDFMKGPEFFMTDRGEQITKENAKLNEKLVPLEELGIVHSDFRNDPYDDVKRGLLNTLLFRATYNGHLFWPKKLLKKDPVVIPFDTGYTPGKMAMHSTYIAYNPVKQTACIREFDRERFLKLEKRLYKDLAYYKKHADAIRKAYRSQKDYLTSEKFWRKYLKMDEAKG